MMYPRWRPAVQNIGNVKITKLANMCEKMVVFNQSEYIGFVTLTASEVFWNISSVFILAVVTSYHLYLQIKVAASISQVSQL